ncbi:hypothetical protein NP493_30g01019 [Ridgeia piscesae]|uniref:ENTH domain-containing protein n=1 Tax=Ridgeia piscesae TaxID=27915 RepID=A0AAD9PD29_RIDPI|nr:hypothetical protein NP493_30g01019 [Ridgeia piscesae]
MYQQLCEITFSSGSNCQQLLDHLVSRLNDHSCHVKLKVLKIMKYLVERGHPQFRQNLRRTSQGITDTTKYSGGPGSAFSSLVRTEAKVLCELLFNVADNDSEVTRPQVTQHTVTGGMGSSQTSGKMQGFGNMLQPKRSMIDRLTSGLQDFADSIVNPSSWKQTSSVNVLPLENQFGSYVPIKLDPKVLVDKEEDLLDPTQCGHRSDPSLPPPTARHLPRGHRRGVAGGGWEDDPEESCDSHMSGDTSGDSNVNQIERLEADQDEDSEDRETELVAGTVKSAASDLLTRAELRTFTAKCMTLNCDTVVTRLSEILATSDSSNVLRSLCLLECLLRTDLVRVDHVAVTSSTCLSHFTTSQHPAPVLMKARKVRC